MKAIYLTGSIIFTVLILILAFENIQSTCSNIKFLFYPVNVGPTMIIMGVAVIGMITGALYHSFISSILNSSGVDDEEDFE